MFDPDRVYLCDAVRNEIYFSTHLDKPGIVELHLPGCDRTLKLSVAAAEDLSENLSLNADAARFAMGIERLAHPSIDAVLDGELD